MTVENKIQPKTEKNLICVHIVFFKKKYEKKKKEDHNCFSSLQAFRLEEIPLWVLLRQSHRLFVISLKKLQ